MSGGLNSNLSRQVYFFFVFPELDRELELDLAREALELARELEERETDRGAEERVDLDGVARLTPRLEELEEVRLETLAGEELREGLRVTREGVLDRARELLTPDRELLLDREYVWGDEERADLVGAVRLTPLLEVEELRRETAEEEEYF
ncbi:hypothetical protein ACFLT9_09370 [Acidobacteriota bacterium]